MSNNATPSLTDRALSRLRKLGEGNGFSADDFRVVEANEATYQIPGSVHMAPTLDVVVRDIKTASGVKASKSFNSFAAMQNAIDQQQGLLTKSKGWTEVALKELNETPGHGWGMTGAKVALPQATQTFVASEPCATCRGSGKESCGTCMTRGQTMCQQCYGRKEEVCHNCYGRGHDPVNPQQVCHICSGRCVITCRICNGVGTITCSRCRGRGYTACAACQGRGTHAREARLTGTAELTFSLGRGTNLPSGLLRSLDRLGQARLPKGHGDVALVPPDDNGVASPASHATVRLIATVPFADIKLMIGDKACHMGAFGKRCLLTGVPPFLDARLAQPVDALRKAAAGQGPIDNALILRIMREAFRLALSGATKSVDLRKLYPQGLSPAMASTIMALMKSSLRYATRTVRLGAAIGIDALAVGLMAAMLLTSCYTKIHALMPIIPHMPLFVTLMVPDLLLPLPVIGLAWLALGQATRMALKRLYPGAPVSKKGWVGKTGTTALALLPLFYAILLFIARPAWLDALLGRI